MAQLKTLTASTETLADKRQVRAIISAEQPDRDGDIVIQAGVSLANFLRTRTVLWNHDHDQPIASCLSIGLVAGTLQALVEFPPAGLNAKSDQVLGLIQTGIINGVSIGFLPIDREPVDRTNPRKGWRIKTSELLEFSFVSVPAQPNAIITARSVQAGADLSADQATAKAQRRRQIEVEELRGGLAWSPARIKRARQMEVLEAQCADVGRPVPPSPPTTKAQRQREVELLRMKG